MNIVNAGSNYMVYGEEVKTYKTLPALTYKVEFSQFKGFYLIVHNDLIVHEKIYGPYGRKVAKVMNTFTKGDRNLGIILSGPKGVGKSMFARQLAVDGRKLNLPLLIVDFPYPGIEDFIGSIDQECIVLFDEFEKTFKTRQDGDVNPQENLLSLFDGVDGGKKLFVVTCNEVNRLNDYLLNRPGRFHYHFIIGTPTGDEVREYMEDNLVGDARQYIDRLVALSTVSAFTYDVLRAIAFELNQGYELSETMMDLNIERERYLHLNVKITFKNGLMATSRESLDLDMFNNRWYNYTHEISKLDLKDPDLQKYCSKFYLGFYTRDVIIDEKGYHLDPSKVRIEWDDDWEYLDEDTDEQKARVEKIKKFMESCQIADISLEKASYNRYSSDFTYKYLI